MLDALQEGGETPHDLVVEERVLIHHLAIIFFSIVILGFKPKRFTRNLLSALCQIQYIPDYMRACTEDNLLDKLLPVFGALLGLVSFYTGFMDGVGETWAERRVFHEVDQVGEDLLVEFVAVQDLEDFVFHHKGVCLNHIHDHHIIQVILGYDILLHARAAGLLLHLQLPLDVQPRGLDLFRVEFKEDVKVLRVVSEGVVNATAQVNRSILGIEVIATLHELEDPGVRRDSSVVQGLLVDVHRQSQATEGGSQLKWETGIPDLLEQEVDWEELLEEGLP